VQRSGGTGKSVDGEITEAATLEMEIVVDVGRSPGNAHGSESSA